MKFVSSASSASVKRPPSKLLFAVFALVILAVTMLGMNYYNASRCAHVKDSSEVDKALLDMKRRLREVESKNIFNALVVKDLLKLLQVHLRDEERETVNKISALSEDKAVSLALLLAATPDLHLERFDMDPRLFENPDALFDVIDASLGRRADLASSAAVDMAVGSNNMLDSASVVLLSDAEQTEKCKSWQSLYRVTVGQSWGELPLGMQRSWVDYGCDSRVSDLEGFV